MAAALQYLPGGQASHCAACQAPAMSLNVPAGQGLAIADVEPAGHQYPAEHCTGSTVPDPQAKPGGHCLQVACPVSFWNNPGEQAVGVEAPSGQK